MKNELISLDFASSDNAAEIDSGIREIIKGMRLSILALGIGLAKIKANGLYRDLKFKNMSQYIEQLCGETKMERSSIFTWMYIGEAYCNFRSDLEGIGFSDSDGPSKLLYLDRALVSNRKQDVLNNIKNMSVREFAAFAKAETVKSVAAAPLVEIRGNTVCIDGKLALIISNKLDRRHYTYFKKIIRIACEVYEEQGAILMVRLNNMKEVRRLRPAVKRLKEKMRKKQERYTVV